MLCPRAPDGATYTPDILGHLKHHLGLQCPQEPWVMMCEMSLHRVKELLVRPACELRPALTVGNPVALFGDHRLG